MNQQIAFFLCTILWLPQVFAACPPPIKTCTDCTLTIGQVSQTYKVTLYSNVGQWSTTGTTGTIPPGLSISVDKNVTSNAEHPNNVVLVGTPTVSGIFTFGFKGEDAPISGGVVQYIPGYGNYIMNKIEIANCVGASSLPTSLPSVTLVPIPIDDNGTVAIMPAARNLPPDPGPAGDATVAGISTAIPGVRDDVVRDITFAYPNNAKARAALFQMAQYWQYILIYNTDANTVAQSWSYISGLSKCFQTAVGNPQANADDTLLPLMLTTHDRSMAYINANETVTVSPRPVTCP